MHFQCIFGYLVQTLSQVKQYVFVWTVYIVYIELQHVGTDGFSNGSYFL